MNPDATDLLTRLFLQASSLDRVDRAAFLDAACAGDVRLRDEVLSLLDHADRGPEYLRTGGLAPRFPALDWKTGTQIGPYRVLGLLGEGGMGIVLRAEQLEPIRRTVAIKILRLATSTPEAVTRFASEVRALAVLNHPHIAHVYDAGTTPEGLPWLAMELVSGEPISAYCERKGLSIDERLVLFRQVCDAVQHAHHNAIIHRDLKRSNVLVTEIDGRPVAKVIDFGIAKFVGQSGGAGDPLTEVGKLVGTPECMSPEQAALGLAIVDARTDVYSLGVLLYELLAGAAPFEDPDLVQLLRRIREEEPQRPSVRTADRRLRGDLDWITMKALEKDPERRYSTPADLGADTGRHLAGEAVAAGPPSATYRLRKLALRHRVAVAFGSLFLVSLVTSSVFATIQARRANAEAAEQEQITQFLLSLFEAPPDLTRNAPGLRGTLEISLKRVREGLEDRPLLRARLLHAMGDAYRALSLIPEALPPLEEARNALLALRGSADRYTLAATESLALALRRSGRFEQAGSLLLEVLASEESAAGKDDVQVLRTAGKLGALYKDWGRIELAVRYLERASRGLETAPGATEAEALTARALLAGSYLELHRYADADRLLVDLLDRMPADHVEISIAHYNLACARANLGHHEQALPELRRAIELGFGYVGSILQDPHLVPLHGYPEFAVLEKQARLAGPAAWARVSALAEREMRDGRYASAESMILQVLDAIGRERRQAGHRDSMAPLLLLADVQLRRGAYAEAERTLLERLDIAERDPRVNRSQFPITYRHLAQCYIALREWTQARDALERSAGAAAPGSNSAGAAYVQAELAALDRKWSEALRFLELAVERGYEDADYLSRDLAFEALRGDAEFRRIAAVVEDRQFFRN
jgi:non-specific serine/threonine protein kinase/serine/threonine-protein kinase